MANDTLGALFCCRCGPGPASLTVLSVGDEDADIDLLEGGGLGRREKDGLNGRKPMDAARTPTANEF